MNPPLDPAVRKFFEWMKGQGFFWLKIDGRNVILVSQQDVEDALRIVENAPECVRRFREEQAREWARNNL